MELIKASPKATEGKAMKRLSLLTLLLFAPLANAQFATPSQWTPAKDSQARPPIVTASSSFPKLTES